MNTLMKIGTYNPVKKTLSKYESFCLLTMYKFDPPIDKELIAESVPNAKIDFSKINKIFTSGSKRSKMTADYLINNSLLNEKTPVEQLNAINEIKFDMGALCTKEEYEKDGSNVVRLQFIKYFIEDRLEESRAKIKARCNKTQSIMNEGERSHDNYLFISHSFFIAIFMAYKKCPELFEKPEKIKDFIDPNKRIMNFCETRVV